MPTGGLPTGRSPWRLAYRLASRKGICQGALHRLNQSTAHTKHHTRRYTTRYTTTQSHPPISRHLSHHATPNAFSHAISPAPTAPTPQPKAEPPMPYAADRMSDIIRASESLCATIASARARLKLADPQSGVTTANATIAKLEDMIAAQGAQGAPVTVSPALLQAVLDRIQSLRIILIQCAETIPTCTAEPEAFHIISRERAQYDARKGQNERARKYAARKRMLDAAGERSAYARIPNLTQDEVLGPQDIAAVDRALRKATTQDETPAVRMSAPLSPAAPNGPLRLAPTTNIAPPHSFVEIPDLGTPGAQGEIGAHTAAPIILPLAEPAVRQLDGGTLPPVPPERNIL